MGAGFRYFLISNLDDTNSNLAGVELHSILNHSSSQIIGLAKNGFSIWCRRVTQFEILFA